MFSHDEIQELIAEQQQERAAEAAPETGRIDGPASHHIRALLAQQGKAVGDE